MRDKLCVGRVIRRFDPYNLRFEGAIVLVHVSEEVQLGLRRADEEDLTVTLEGLGNLTEKSMLVVGVIPDAHVLFVGVTMNVPARRMDQRFLDLVGIDLDDPSFLLINPYDGVLHVDSYRV